jgi:hypothetical protein
MQEMGDVMVDSIYPEPQPDCTDRLPVSWRAIAAAWALVALLMVLFTGAEAFAARHATAPGHARVAGAVIPRHDPACADIPTDACPGFALTLAEMERNAYPLW